MNLQQSDDEFRLQMQRTNDAESDRGRRASNPFAAALGISSIVVLVWFLFAVAPIVGQLALFARDAIDFATSLFGSIRSADWRRQVSFGLVYSIGLRFTMAPPISMQVCSTGRERDERSVGLAFESLG